MNAPRRNSHVQNGIYYFSGTGSNDGYPKDDHVLVTDPFEKHVTRTMDALKKSVERAGSNMDSLIHLDVFFCLPHADSIAMPAGKARFDAHKAQYDALNKIYRTYFSQGKAPSRACMAVEWIPGDSLIEIVGSALVVGPPVPSRRNRVRELGSFVEQLGAWILHCVSRRKGWLTPFRMTSIANAQV